MKIQAAITLVLCAVIASAQVGITSRVSEGFPLPINAPAERIAVNNSGRYVVYESEADNIVGLDNNGFRDIFLHDWIDGITEIISVVGNNTSANEDSSWADVSGNGRYIVFQSSATNLIAMDTNGVSDIFVRDRQIRNTYRVSVSTGGIQANGSSFAPVISDDGQFVAFVSTATNLVAGDTNGQADAFLYNLGTGACTRISVSSANAQANGTTTDVAIDGNGDRIAFSSAATNLVAGDTNGVSDVFLRNTSNNTTTLESRSTGGVIGNGISRSPSLNATGDRIAFRSASTNLVAGDTNGVDDVFVRNTSNSTTIRASVSSSSVQGNGTSIGAAMHPNAESVAFQSTATNLVAGDTNNTSDVFLKDLSTGEVRRLSASSGGTQGNGASTAPAVGVAQVMFLSDANNLVAGDTNGFTDGFRNSTNGGSTARVTSTGLDGNGYSGLNDISALGRYVVFESSSDNLIEGDTNSEADIFRLDIEGFFTQRLSLSSLEAQANGPSSDPSVSADGRYVAFASEASNLVFNDTNATQDIFVRDVLGETTSRVSVSTAGAQANGPSRAPEISGNGRYIVFESDASNLVVGDTNGQTDIFVHDRQTSQTIRVSVNSSEQQATAGSSAPAINYDGGVVAFSSVATNLVVGDTNGSTDVFVRNLAAGTTERVSVSTAGAQANDNSLACDLNDDGSKVAFSSFATNLVAGDTNASQDVFLRDRSNNTTLRLSVSTANIQGNASSSSPSISADGMSVSFSSSASNLIAADSNGFTPDCFVRSIGLGITRIVSVDSLGQQNSYPLSGSSISGDGLAVTFFAEGPFTPLDRNGSVDVYLNDARLVADTLTLIRGVVEGGSHGSTLSSDDIYYTLRPGITFTTSQAPIELVGEVTGLVLNPTRLEFAIEFNATAPAIRQVIEMYNFDTNAYEVVDTRQSTTTDSVVVIAITSNAGRFVDAQGKMRTRISYKANGPVFAYPWRTRIDHTRWTVY